MTFNKSKLIRIIIITAGVAVIGYVHGGTNALIGLLMYLIGAVFIGVGLYAK